MQENVKNVFRSLPCWYDLVRMTEDEMLEFAQEYEFLEIAKIIKKDKISFDDICLEKCVIFLTLLLELESVEENTRTLKLSQMLEGKEDRASARHFFNRLHQHAEEKNWCWTEQYIEFDGLCLDELHSLSGQEWAELMDMKN